MVDIVHRVGIKAPIADVYSAISTVEGVAGWWTKETTGVSNPGGNIDVLFLSQSGEKLGAVNMDVIELVPDKKVHWRFTSGPEEWIGTDVIFDLVREGDYTIVLFGHRNWREQVEMTSHCSMKWAVFMLSLKELVETGQGRPSPIDIKIDNWN